MKLLRSFLLCLIALFLGGCGKKQEALKNELSEAGYEMTLESWFEMIRSNKIEVMKKMAKGGFDVKSKDQDGRDGLHVASEAGSIEAARYLLDLGLSIDGKDGSGKTPLMHAVIADKREMVKWLLNQRANPREKDSEGFMALTLAVTNDSNGSIEELAPYHRADLDAALLFAAIVGNAGAIDILTNYGASVYARMEDGRTPLMLAAENGNRDAVAMLLDIGASRLASTEGGDTAHSLAVAAGHDEIASLIERGFGDATLAFESDEEVLQGMEDYIVKLDAEHNESSQITDNKPVDAGTAAPRKFQTSRGVGSIEGARISNSKAAPDGVHTNESGAAGLPLVMRHYRQRELPVEVKQVSEGRATIRLAGTQNKEISVRVGDAIPSSRLVVVKVYRRTETGKLNQGQPIEVGVVEVEDKASGQRREWIAGQPASSHDPVALVEDSATGQRYVARPGQKFFSEDGREFVVNDVRPGQLVIEETATGEVSTLPLRGTKG